MRKKKLLSGIVALLSATILFTSLKGDDKHFELAKQLNIFASLYRDVNMFYVDSIDISKVMKKGIDAMLKELDPYTVYYPEDETDDVKFMTTGEYAGIGAVVSQTKDYVIIREPYRGTPSFKAGLVPGDKILSIDGESMKGKTTPEVSDKLRGAPGKELTIEVERVNGEKKKVKLVREKVQTPSVPYYGLLDGQVGYIYLTSFTDKSAMDVRKALIDLKNQGAKEMILDLRGNGGGLLNQAVEIVGFFLPRGTMVVTTKGKIKEAENVLKTQNSPILPDMPLAVLINSASASASEIVSGALQDNDRAVVIGTRSFGKGLVQTVRDLPYKSQVKLTTAKYYIPSGRCIQAIDYSHRNEDGSVGTVPDSLKKAFKTTGGRTVYDGGGIAPDLKIVHDKLASVTKELLIEDAFFNFVNQYAMKHDTIAAPSKFQLTDGIYDAFIAYLKKNDFQYTTESQEQLEKLVAKMKQEKYFDENKEELDLLKEELGHSIERDMELHRKQISALLADQVVSRYYQMQGVLEYGTLHDKEVKKAIEILTNPTAYKSLLTVQPTTESKKK